MTLCQLCWWVLAEPFKIALDTLPFTLTCIELYAGEHDAQLHGRAVLFCVDLMNPVVSVDFVQKLLRSPDLTTADCVGLVDCRQI
jgi:hypothetical protein